MSFTGRLRSLLGIKESQARVVASFTQVGQPQITPANYTAFAEKGYSKNAIVYSAITKITTASMGINWLLYNKTPIKKNRKEILEHPLLKLWERPNPLQASASFMESLVGYKLISGNAYIEANKPTPNKPPVELWIVRPDKMKVVPNALGNVGKYVYTENGFMKEWLVDAVTMKGDILHLKTFNPTNIWYGLSPLEAALLSLDQNNASARWNLSLLQNSATPSGVLQMKVSDANPRGELTDEQYKRIKNEFDNSYAGARNAGRALILEGGLSWSSMSLSPKDMEFINAKEITATDIALVYNVPPELLGLGEKTYSNYQEARAALYEEAVLPLMDNIRDELNRWLVPQFGDGLYLDYDKDDIEALSYKRDAKYTSISNSNFLTQNEKREAVGYEPKEDWDVFVIANQIIESPEDFVVSQGTTLDSTLEVSDEGEEETDTTETTDVEAEIRKVVALNGAQVSSLVEVINLVAQGQLPRDSALNIIVVAFNLTEEQADLILGDVGRGFEPEPLDDSTSSTDTAKGFKTLNLLNANEKRRSWFYQNRKRQKLTNEFKKDLEKDFNDLTQRLVKKADELKNSDIKVIEYALVKELSEWSKDSDFKKTLSKHTKETLETFGGIILGEAKEKNLLKETKTKAKFDSFVLNYIEQRTATQISTITSTTQKRMQRIVREWVAEAVTEGDSIPELSKYLQLEFEDLTPKNATRIARTEVGLASNNGSLQAVKSLDLPNMKKEWVTASDGRVRDGEGGYADHTHMNGKRVGLDEKFDVPPDATMDGPGDPSASADQVINCRCVLVYSSEN